MRGGSTVLCGVFRAPREYNGEEYSEYSGMRVKTTEKNTAECGRIRRSACPLGRWLEYKNTYSASSRSSPSDMRLATGGGVGGCSGATHSCGDGSESAPTPAQLTAATWKRYGTAATRFVMMARASLVPVSLMPTCHGGGRGGG